MTASRRSTVYCVQIFARGEFARTLPELMNQVTAEAFVATYNRWQPRTGRHAVAVALDLSPVQSPGPTSDAPTADPPSPFGRGPG